MLIRSAPQGESWEGLRKGGTAGIYVVIMGLSWWIKLQLMERDPHAWTAVDDVAWVIQQMTIGASGSTMKTRKRSLEGKEKDDHARKR